MIQQLRDTGVNVVHLGCMAPPEQWLAEGRTNVSSLMAHIMRGPARDGCYSHIKVTENYNFQSLQDIIYFNKTNATTEFDVFCSNQNGLIKAQ